MPTRRRSAKAKPHPTRRRSAKAKPHPTRRRSAVGATRRDSVALVVRDPNGFVPQPQAAPLAPWVLSEAPMMSASFIGTFKLTEQQIQALRRPVEDHEVEWKPARKGGEPAIPYLAHGGYRDRLDAAFGIGGWGTIPVSQPKEKDGIVYVLFAVVVEGVPRAYAWGEQEYHATKADGSESRHMTYGDALEGARSNALVRCAKDCWGVARELWNRRYIEALKQRVPASQRVLAAGVRPPPPPSSARTGSEQDPISPQQRVRLSEIAERARRTPKEMREYLQQVYRVKSSRDLLQRDYAAACAAVEARGPLPTKQEKAREPDAVLPAEAPLREGDIGWGLK